MNQPRVPEYREADDIRRHLRNLNLFLKDFSLETWRSVIQLSKAKGEEKGEEIPPSFRIDEHGHLIWTDAAGRETDLGDVTGRDAQGLYAFHIDENGHLMLMYDTQIPPPISIDDRGHLIYTLGPETTIDLGAVTGGGSGTPAWDVDKTLRIKDGVLSVNTAQAVEEDNTLPVTSAAVYETVGNINALLETI